MEKSETIPEIHSINTRHKDDFCMSNVSITTDQKIADHSGIMVVRTLQSNIKIFKQHIKAFQVAMQDHLLLLCCTRPCLAIFKRTNTLTTFLILLHLFLPRGKCATYIKQLYDYALCSWIAFTTVKRNWTLHSI